MADVARDTLPLLEEIRDHLADQGRVNHAIARIDRLRQKMNDLGPMYDLVTQLTQKSELERFRADMQLAAVSDPHEKQAQQITRDIANCRGILQAAEEFSAMMSHAIEAHTAHPGAAPKGAK